MKNQDVSIQGKTVSAEKFNPPTRHEVYDSDKGQCIGQCFVYDARSWRNRNKRSSSRAEEAK